MTMKKMLLIPMFIIVLTACNNDADSKVDDEYLDNLNEEGMPIVEDPITLDFFAGESPSTNDDWNDVLVYNEYEEMTNIDINWDMVPFDSMDEKRNLALGGG